MAWYISSIYPIGIRHNRRIIYSDYGSCQLAAVFIGKHYIWVLKGGGKEKEERRGGQREGGGKEIYRGTEGGILFHNLISAAHVTHMYFLSGYFYPTSLPGSTWPHPLSSRLTIERPVFVIMLSLRLGLSAPCVSPVSHQWNDGHFVEIMIACLCCCLQFSVSLLHSVQLVSKSNIFSVWCTHACQRVFAPMCVYTFAELISNCPIYQFLESQRRKRTTN